MSGLLSDMITASLAKHSRTLTVNCYFNGHPDLVVRGVYAGNKAKAGGPYAWCELHHLSPWRNGGTTALANAVPVCPYHHHQLDNPRYHHQVYTDDQGRHTITLRRRT